MIDIHSHFLPYVDDGSPSAEISLAMLKTAAGQGVTDIICTPHYRGNYKPEKEGLIKDFKKFCELKDAANIGVELYLGEEVFYNARLFGDIKTAPFSTLAGGKYVLTEFSPEAVTGVYDAALSVLSQGYIPVIAHIERCVRLSEDYIADVRALGALIQVNACSFAGREKKFFGKRVYSLFSEGLVDLVASDFHYSRDYCMDKAYRIVRRKFGEDVAETVFVSNAKKIIGESL